MALSSGVIAWALVLLSASAASAQSTATVWGTVTDSKNNLMPGVSVSLERDGTAPLKTITGKEGDYLLTEVPAGTYRLVFFLEGFKKTVRVGLLAVAGHEFRADQRMEVSTFDAYNPPVISASVAYDAPKTVVGTTFTKTVSNGAPAAPRDVTGVLAKAASYLASFEKAFSVVVAEESYRQTLISNVVGRRNTGTQRNLRSDVLQTSVGQNDWVAFRDVFEVDGKQVRDRDTRLQKLFLDAPAEALAQTKRIVAESARYNIGTLQRNINVPTMALTYLRPVNQSRSEFVDGGRQKIEGVNAVVLVFTEKARPTIVRSGLKDLPATGRFWIDAESGRVLKTEVSIAGAGSPAKISVTYGPVPKLTTWAPILMEERYDGAEMIRAEATYSNFRQFSVAVAASIK